MGKLPKSSRPGRRGPSPTFNHPYQLNIFVPIASTLREVGAVAKVLIPIYAGLIYGYMSNAQPLGDGSALKQQLLSQSGILAGILALIFAVEVLRTIKAFDYERLGRFPKYTLIALNLLGSAYAIYAIVYLPALNSYAHNLRLQEKERQDSDKRRKEEATVAECNAQKVKEIEVLTKRRAAAFGEHKKCTTEYVKPLFSAETAEQACAAKLAAYHQLAQSVKTREAKECAPATK